MREVPKEAWQDAVADVADHVDQRAEAEAVAAVRQKPKSKAPRIAAASVVLAGLTALNVTLFLQPPDSASPTEERAHLAWLVGDVVDEVEAFREENGRFPTEAELEDIFADDVDYAPDSDQYAVAAEGDHQRVEYESNADLSTWMQTHGAGGEGAGQ